MKRIRYRMLRISLIILAAVLVISVPISAQDQEPVRTPFDAAETVIPVTDNGTSTKTVTIVAPTEIPSNVEVTTTVNAQSATPTATLAADLLTTQAADTTATHAANSSTRQAAILAATQTVTETVEAAETMMRESPPTATAGNIETTDTEQAESASENPEPRSGSEEGSNTSLLAPVALCLIFLFLLLVASILMLLLKRRRVVAVIAAPPAAYLRLGDDGRRFEIMHTPFSIGRSEDNLLIIDDTFEQWQTISRNHAVITEHPKGYVIEDRGSSNGIRVQGRATQKNLLKNGWRVDIGGVEFTFHLGVDSGEQL